MRTLSDHWKTAFVHAQTKYKRWCLRNRHALLENEKRKVRNEVERTSDLHRGEGRWTSKGKREPTCKGPAKAKALIDRKGAPAQELSHTEASKETKKKKGKLAARNAQTFIFWMFGTEAPERTGARVPVGLGPFAAAALE